MCALSAEHFFESCRGRQLFLAFFPQGVSGRFRKVTKPHPHIASRCTGEVFPPDLLRRYFRSSAVLRAISGPSSRVCWKKLFAFAMPALETSIDGMAALLIHPIAVPQARSQGKHA